MWLPFVKGRLGENRSLILRTVAHNPRWKKWFGLRSSAISTNQVRFLRGQVGDSDNIDLNLNITQVGETLRMTNSSRLISRWSRVKVCAPVLLLALLLLATNFFFVMETEAVERIIIHTICIGEIHVDGIHLVFNVTCVWQKVIKSRKTISGWQKQSCYVMKETTGTCYRVKPPRSSHFS